jgi:uncharacterized protein (DUF1501 family)
VRIDGNTPAIGLATLDGTDIYLTPAAPELKALYDAGQVAFVHATGVPTADRSHFTVQEMMERGIGDADPNQNTGWLARHMASLGGTMPILSTVASNATPPSSLLGDNHVIAIPNASTFAVSGGDANATVIRNMNAGASPYNALAKETLNAITSVQVGLRTVDNTSATNAGYPGGALAQSLRSIGQLIKMNVGLTVATVDHGGWDMHNNLTGEFNQRMPEFSRAVNAFWTDMQAYRHRITLVTMTEFGRRLQENTSAGTDHGSASGMMILSGNVNGGRLYGQWPGLAPSQLNAGDLRVTTDYRRVIAEILVKRHGEQNVQSVFPTVPYAPLGIMKETPAS